MGILRGEGEKSIFSPYPMEADINIDITDVEKGS